MKKYTFSFTVTGPLSRNDKGIVYTQGVRAGKQETAEKRLRGQYIETAVLKILSVEVSTVQKAGN